MIFAFSPDTRCTLPFHAFLPFEGLRPGSAAGETSPPRKLPLVGLAALQSVVRDSGPGCLGYPVPRGVIVSEPPCEPAISVAGCLHIQLILSCASPSLQSSRSRAGPALSSGLLPWAFFPHRGDSVRSPHPAGVPGPLRSVLDVSHVLDGFLLCTPSRVCFTPQPRPGFALQGVSLASSRTGSSPAVALLSLPGIPDPRLPECRTRRARLQGLAPLANPSQHAVVEAAPCPLPS
jgi:hypothetical protein